MLKRDSSGIVLNQTKDYEDISFFIRNNGNDTRQVRFFAENSSVPIEDGNIFGQATASSPALVGNNPEDMQIANGKLYVGGDLSIDIYSLPDLSVINRINTAPPFGIDAVINVPTSQEVWELISIAGDLRITTIDTVNDTLGITNTLVGFNYVGSFSVDDSLNNQVWLWSSTNGYALIDKTTLTINSIIPQPFAFAFPFSGAEWSRNGTRYVAVSLTDFGANNVLALYDVNNGTQITTISTGGFRATSIQYNPNDNYVYFLDFANNVIGRISMETYQVESFNTGLNLSGIGTTFDKRNYSLGLDTDNNVLYFPQITSGDYAYLPLETFNASSIITANSGLAGGVDFFYFDATNDQIYAYANGTNEYAFINTVNNTVNSFTFPNSVNTGIVFTESPRRVYVFNTNFLPWGVSSFETINTVDLIDSTASDGAKQAFTEIKFNPINCTKVRLDAQSNRQQATNPLNYFTTTGTGLTKTKLQPLIWNVPATERFTIIELKDGQISEGGLKLDGQNGFLLDIEGNTEVYIEFAFKQQGFTDVAILENPKKRSHLKDGSIEHPNVL